MSYNLNKKREELMLKAIEDMDDDKFNLIELFAEIGKQDKEFINLLKSKIAAYEIKEKDKDMAEMIKTIMDYFIKNAMEDIDALVGEDLNG